MVVAKVVVDYVIGCSYHDDLSVSLLSFLDFVVPASDCDVVNKQTPSNFYLFKIFEHV